MAETIEQRLRKNLSEQGVFDEQIDEIMQRVKSAPENASMAQRWNDLASDYPPTIMSLAWFSTKRHALEYIDEKCPQAWFRPLFVSESSGSNDEQLARCNATEQE